MSGFSVYRVPSGFGVISETGHESALASRRNALALFTQRVRSGQRVSRDNSTEVHMKDKVDPVVDEAIETLNMKDGPARRKLLKGAGLTMAPLEQG